MHFFTTLTPAENLLIRDGRDASLKQLLEVTFMDLLLKRILKIEHTNDETADPNEVQAAYVSVGKNYPTYVSAAHEQILLEPFVAIVKTRILLTNLIKIIFEGSKGPRKYQRCIAGSPAISTYFRSPWFFHSYGFFPLNKKGREVKDQVLLEQKSLTNTFTTLWENDRRKALAIIEEIKGNIFLIPISRDIIKTLGLESDTQMSTSKAVDNSAGGGCGGFYYSDFHHVSSGFDEGESDSSWGSGCSGDSGGDSGCGGCGGD